MKKLIPVSMLILAMTLTGCIWRKSKPAETQSASAVTPAPVTAPATIVTPDASLVAKVVSVNTVGRFVILNFPSGQLPKLQQTLFLYRAGLKAAEVKITGPQTDNKIVADLISGEAQVGDTVRE